MDMLTVFVGVIAICMIVITSVVLWIGVQSFKTMQKIQDFIGHIESELSFIATKGVMTLHQINELIVHLKDETKTLSDKSKLSLHELHDLISFLHDETKSLALKASNGIAKVTIGSLAIGAISQMLKKKKE
jgi:uncharacterized protein YoxC